MKNLINYHMKIEKTPDYQAWCKRLMMKIKINIYWLLIKNWLNYIFLLKMHMMMLIKNVGMIVFI